MMDFATFRVTFDVSIVPSSNTYRDFGFGRERLRVLILVEKFQACSEGLLT